jgi:hypothetical protein
MATTTLNRRTELAQRTSDGIDVHLFWNEPGRRVTVSVFDERTNDGFELEVDGRDALDAFNHPFVYAARGGTGDPSFTGRQDQLQEGDEVVGAIRDLGG